MGIVAPNAIGLDAFRRALCEGQSGLAYSPRMQELNFGCHVVGIPQISDEYAEERMGSALFRNANSSMKYAALAAMECWEDAGLTLPRAESDVEWGTAAIIGTCLGGVDT